MKNQISIEDQIKCVEREIGMRQRAYPRWVKAGTMNEGTATKEIQHMKAVLVTLQEIRARADNVQPGLFDQAEWPE